MSLKIASIKEKTFYFSIFFFVSSGYLLTSQLALSSAPHPTAFMEWEKNIPYGEYFIIPYFSYFIIPLLAFFAFKQTSNIMRQFVFIFALIAIVSLTIFVFYPHQFGWKRPAPTTGFETIRVMLAFLEADEVYNTFPSLHVSFTVAFWYMMKDHIKNRIFYHLTWSWLVLIVLSTLFVFQHHFVDVVTGIFLFYAAYAVTHIKLLRQFF